MSKLNGKTCPVFKSACLMDNCTMYDSRLDNCVVHVGSYNMYLVATALRNLDQVAGSQNRPKTPGFPGMN